MDLRAALLALFSALPLTQTCALSPTARSAPDQARSCFTSADGGRVRSTLTRRVSSRLERLTCVTEVADAGARLVEDVTLDEGGALLRAEAVLTTAGDTSEKRIVFDPEHGTVDMTGPLLHLHWDVPRDFPWIWAPLLTANVTGAPIATPLDARVVWRAAAGGRTVRLLDLGTLQSYSLASDQVVSPGADGGTVVLGSDASEIEHGMPKSLHLAAMNTDLVSTELAQTSSALLAVAGCLPPRGLFAP